MPRGARIVIPNVPHHITQRGNNKQDVFFVDDDKVKFLNLLKKQSRKFGLIIDGFCLMTNHIHIISTPTKEDSLAKTMGRTNLLYSQYLNYMHGRTGHLWQNRFFSCPLDTNYFFTALCYIEQNPARGKMVRSPWTYRWSSAAFHASGNDEFGLMDNEKWQRLSSGLDWKAILRKRTESVDMDRLRVYCRTGRPLGSDKFISKLETFLGRRLRALPVGRPKNKKDNKKKKKIKTK
ncbi:MAG TPA: transposase [Phycisphaerales bacterium]|nr:transposase [Phycisphaerales bacterium]